MARTSKTARSTSNTGHPIRVENPIDVRPTSIDLPIENIAQRIAAPDAHRDVEHERQIGKIDLRREGDDIERDALLAGEVAGLRAPDDGDVDIVSGNRVNDVATGRLGPVVAVHRVAGYIINDAALAESVGGRRVDVVVADHLYPDSQSVQPRIVERPNV